MSLFSFFDNSIPRDPVRSSNLRSVGYDRWARRLEIEFRGGRIYAYFDVPEYIHSQLMGASSKGRFFHYNIKGRYRYRRL